MEEDKQSLLSSFDVKTRVENGSGYSAGHLQHRNYAIAMFLANVALCLLAWWTAAMADFGTNKKKVSEWQYVFAVFNSFAVMYGIYDLVKTFAGTTGGQNGVLTFEWNHSTFKRASYPATLHLLTFFPNLLTFVTQAAHVEFHDIFGKLDSSIGKLVSFHVAIFVVFTLSTVGTFLYIRILLHRGHFGQHSVSSLSRQDSSNSSLEQFNHANCALVSGKAALGVMTLCIPFFCFTLLYSIKIHVNSGIIISAIVAVPMELFLLAQSSRLLAEMHPKNRKWLVSYRAVMASNVAVSYLAFWVVLVLLTLKGTKNKDFFESLTELSSVRKTVLSLFFISWVLFFVTYAIRLYHTKLRKGNRLPHVVPAAHVDFNPAQHARKKSNGGSKAEQGSVPEIPQVQAEEVTEVAVEAAASAPDH
mmetsp:Transcript_49188/g.96441  ORF Transcript_49188/g.96441 Transcript_49188/m.96441 type:complete len:417 (+) Transcript_49188:39-1289(+)